MLKPRNLEEVYKKIVATGKDKYIFKLILFMMKDGYLIVKVNPKNNSVFMDAQITIEIQKNVGTCNPFLMTPYKRCLLYTSPSPRD